MIHSNNNNNKMNSIYNIVALGNTGVGKSSLIRYYYIIVLLYKKR